MSSSPPEPPSTEATPFPKRDVAGRVFVEQRVVEDRPERADPAASVDERNLAEARCAFVELGASA